MVTARAAKFIFAVAIIASLIAVVPVVYLALSAYRSTTPPRTVSVNLPGCAVAREGVEVSALRVTSPAPRQIFQRYKDSGDVHISAIGEGQFECVEAEVRGLAGSEIVVPWTELKFAAGKIEAVVHIPRGGWYQVRLRTVKSGVAGSPVFIDRVGVGEVFITAGQSNSSFFGETPTVAKRDDVSYFDGETWAHCQDPLPAIIPFAHGGSPWCHLGDRLAEKLAVPVAFAPVGWAASSVAQWQSDGFIDVGVPRGFLYERMQSRLRQFGPHGLRAVLWHQGEADVTNGTTAKDYASRLQSLIRHSRAASGFEIPWFIAIATYSDVSKYNCAAPELAPFCRSPEIFWDQISAGQAEVIDGKSIFIGAETNSLRGPRYRYDGVHMTVLGLQEHARLWADKLIRAWPTLEKLETN